MTHSKNAEYVNKWRQQNRARYLEQNTRSTYKINCYKRAIKELYNIDPTLFL